MTLRGTQRHPPCCIRTPRLMKKRLGLIPVVAVLVLGAGCVVVPTRRGPVVYAPPLPPRPVIVEPPRRVVPPPVVVVERPRPVIEPQVIVVEEPRPVVQRPVVVVEERPIVQRQVIVVEEPRPVVKPVVVVEEPRHE